MVPLEYLDNLELKETLDLLERQDCLDHKAHPE